MRKHQDPTKTERKARKVCDSEGIVQIPSLWRQLDIVKANFSAGSSVWPRRIVSSGSRISCRKLIDGDSFLEAVGQTFLKWELQDHRYWIGQCWQNNDVVSIESRRCCCNSAYYWKQRRRSYSQQHSVVKVSLFECWDLGGQESLRPSWSSYYVNAHAIILVVDSTDRERIPSVRDELRNLLSHDDLKKAVILILANKQDLRVDAMTAVEISDNLLLHSIKSHEWHIQAACALTGEGHREGLDWIASKLK
eukprot:766346-Hanusia_phi.AAC.5